MVKLKKIYFVRHCIADGQHKDSPLTTVGIRQAHLLSVFLTKQNITIDKVISSPYLRAVESIKPFAGVIKKDIQIDERLQERILSNEPVDDWIDVLEHSFNDHDFTLPGGESANDAKKRANKVLEMINSDDNITNALIVSHGNLLALLFQQYDKNFGFKQWKELSNPDVYAVTLKNGDTSFECLWRA